MVDEKRLIWDEDAKRRIIALAVGHHTDTLPIDAIINVILHRAPTVDAVEVVRCKDCDNTCPGNTGLVCTIWGAGTEPEAFCSYGERRAE